MHEQKIEESPINAMYYWITSRQYPAQCGEVLEVGRWGRMFKERPIAYSGAFYYIDELVYETVRLRYYVDQISRLEAFFFFDNLDCARKFARKELVYEIELLDQNAKVDRHIMNDIGVDLYEGYPLDDPITSIVEIEKNAHRYWNYTPRPQTTTELLTKSPVKVIRRI
jgi:hypothetical protein